MTSEKTKHFLLSQLVESPETVIWTHVLKRGNCEAYLLDGSEVPVTALVQAHGLTAEPTGFGTDTRRLWQLLKYAAGWQCILVDKHVAPELGPIVEQNTRAAVRYLDDIYHVPEGEVAPFQSALVRLLTVNDIPMLKEASPDLRPVGFWEDVTSSLETGIAAAAIVGGAVVSTAFVAALGERYADIGVYTLENHRRHGLATAAASLVARLVQERGLVPVWGCGEHNAPSLRLAKKLGFVETSRRTYVVIEKYMQEVADRTYPIL